MRTDLVTEPVVDREINLYRHPHESGDLRFRCRKTEMPVFTGITDCAVG